MAVLPWGHSRSRTTSNDKRSNAAREWFTRAGTAEPSRQALTLLMKQHTRAVSAESSMGKDGSRSSTAQSHRYQNSHHSEDDSVISELSISTTALPPAIRPTSPAFSVASAFERPETPSKSFFSRHGSLRRKGSKMSINSEIGSSSTVTSPSRFSPSRLGFRKKDVPASPIEDEKPQLTISQPFAFQHVTHTEQSHFSGLSRIDESELVNKFGALQASQRAEHGLRGFPASKLSPIHRERPCSPPPEMMAELPVTPPRPSPPPKDSPRLALQTPSPDIRTSRSMENFSRPTPKSPTSPVNDSTNRLFPSHLPPVIETSHDPDSSSADVLIYPPSIVHAVSTEDGSARRMITAPLPIPPRNQSLVHNAQFRQQAAAQGHLRHMSTFPSPRNQRLSQSIQTNNLPQKRKNSPAQQSATMKSKLSSSRSKADWEDAIDYAWDHVDEQSPEEDSGSDVTSTAVTAKLADVMETNQQMQNAASSASSSPKSAYMTAEGGSPVILPQLPSEFIGTTDDQVIGLGIESGRDYVTSAVNPYPPTLTLAIPESSIFDGMYQLPRGTSSGLSKSSSQESIILSIASSIMGTQRSSNSSVNPTDMARLSKCDEPVSATVPTASAMLKVESQKAARPESTCVPMALMTGFTAQNSGSEESVLGAGHIASESIQMEVQKSGDVMTPLPHAEVHDEVATASNNPRSRSGSSNSRTARQRSNTQTSRRGGRVSYSLFPTASS